MRRVYQTSQGLRNGDCLRCCVASLLDLSADEVPNFFEGVAQGSVLTTTALTSLDAWMAARGLLYAEFMFATKLDDLMESMQNANPALKYVLTGVTRDGYAHAVVCQGNIMLHDPASGSLVMPLRGPGPFGAYGVGVITKLL